MKRFIVFLISLGLVACLVGCGGSGSDDSSYTRSSVISDIASADIYIDNGETYEQQRAFATCFLDYLLNEGISLKRISDYHTGGSKEKGYSDISGAYISARDCRNLRN